MTAPTPWRYRHGRKQIRNIYRVTGRPPGWLTTSQEAVDEFLGVMFTEDYAHAVIEALNAYTPDQHRGLADPPGSPYSYLEHSIYVHYESNDAQVGSFFTETDAALVAAALNYASHLVGHNERSSAP